MRVPLYTRLDRRTHHLLSQYARSRTVTLNDLVEGLVAQLLFQVSADFEPPGWLLDAVESGELPIRRCSGASDEDFTEDEGGLGNLISLGR